MGDQMRKAAIFVAVTATLAWAGSATATSTNTRSDVDKHTRAYVKQVRGCVTIAALSLQIASKQSDIKASATMKEAADTCDSIRHRLATMNDDHFSKQA